MGSNRKSKQQPPPPTPPSGLRPFVWWILWAALLTGFVQVCYYALSVRRPPPPPLVAILAVLVAAGLLLVSVAIRWLLLPRIPRAGVAFVFFLVGQALAEGCGYVGLFFGGAHGDVLVVGGALGLLQYAPLFLRKSRFRGAA